MSLHNFQKNFSALLFQPRDTFKQPPANITEHFSDNDIDIHEGLEAYHANVLGSLTNAILQSFPLIASITGEDFLRAMAKSFIIKNPPSTACLNTYGDTFDAFIAQYPPARSLPYLPDIARLEIACNAAFYAHDDQPFTAQDMAKVAPDQLEILHLTLRQNVRTITSEYKLWDIRKLCLGVTNDEIQNFNAPKAEHLLISRPQLEVHVRPISLADVTFLSAIQDEETLGQAAAKTLGAHPNYDLQQALARFINADIFTINH